MKRFIVISLLWAVVQPMLACAGLDTNNYYLFSLYNRECFHERAERLTEKNWQAYIGNTDESYWFNATEVMKVARQKNDALMVSYLQNLEKYLDCARQVSYEQWNYPTKEDLADRNSTLQAVAQYAYGKVKSRLRSQHGLLYMRCNMLLKRHAQNISFWENTASGFIESVYKDMMKDIYAGALVKNGRRQEGCNIFVELSDWESLMTVYYEKRSFQAIKQEYQRDPNSKILPFLLQDFVNNTQEAADATNGLGGIGGKLFIRDISRNEAQQMCQLAETVVREGKSESPEMWKSAEAWIHYLLGYKEKAQIEINNAMELDGEGRIHDNTRALYYFINFANKTVNEGYDLDLMTAFDWLKEKNDEEKANYGYIGSGHYREVCERLINQVLLKKYEEAGRPLTMLCLNSLGTMVIDPEGCEPSMYQIGFGTAADSMEVNEYIALVESIKAPATNRLDRWLKSKLQLDENVSNDLTGTKYLRLCQWEKAIKWLQKVPLSYYNKNQGIMAYASRRHWTVEPWITRQWISERDSYSQDNRLASNYKIDFAREMMQLENQRNMSRKKDGYYQLCYDLAVRYAQVDFTGDCWYIMRASKSYTDERWRNETDLQACARRLLAEAAQTSDPALRERALFAQCYVYLNADRWYTTEWNGETYDYERHLQTSSNHWKAWAALAAYESSHGASDYVSRCDEYRQFMKNR